jgi:hypothetical protein
MSQHFNVDWNKVDGSVENGAPVALGGDNEYQAEFYLGKVPNFDMTDYTEVPHLRLRAPGSATVYDQPVRMESYPGRPSDPERFPLSWAAFQNGADFTGNGTPLTNIEGITEGDIRRLDINGVRTVEQLARVADTHLGNLGLGARMLRDQARAHMAGHRVDPEKKALQDQVGKLTDIVTALMERLGGSIDELLPAGDAGEADGENGGEQGDKAAAPRRQRQAAEA